MAQDVTFNITFIDKFSRIGNKLKGSVDKTTKSMKKFDAQGGKMARTLKKLGKNAKETGKNIAGFGKKLALATTVPLAGFGILAIKAAASAEEMESKLNAAFGDSTGDIHEWSLSFGKAANRGTNDLRQMAADAGALMGNMFKGPELAAVSKDMVQMAEDLGSFFDTTSEVAFGKIASGLAGSFEPLRQFGVMTNKAEIDTKAMTLAGVRNVDQLTEGMRANALFAIIQEKQSAAMGDAVRTSDSFTNQMKGLKGAIKDVTVNIGNELIPMVLPMVKAFAGWINKLKEANPKMLKMGIMIGIIVAVVAPLIILIGFLVTAFAAIGAAIAIPVAIGAALIATFAAVWFWSEEIWNGIKKVANIMSKITPLGILLNAIGDGVIFMMEQFAMFSLDGLLSKFTGFLDGIPEGVKSFFGLSTETKGVNETKIGVEITTKDNAGVIADTKITRQDISGQSQTSREAA